ncbi:peptide ABC transporter substrate-binding protein [Tistrella mobilis]|uniref:ABC superfamily ATP binding cassette transporter substrate-binding protein n=1 Tax=Tistrella mobilis (strain KA081020-065) TaxID=1110502 RepID=I3TJD1_TISMK|nr:peptide ABC transporter substrate-binding protein [Tistrella mobilis]AFK52869.1 ABC superfamily ATP binding cassette transporter substrate-binding protein [Tistrella mobilis KA081020-065]
MQTPSLSKRSFLKLSAAAGVAGAVGGMAAGPLRALAAGPEPRPGGQVIAGISQEPTVFNPLMPGSEYDQGIWWQVFSTLWYIDADGTIVPDLAAELPTVANGGLSADGRIWKVRLRKGITWHDGTPFTAHDVKYTLDLINNPDFKVRNRVGHSLLRNVTVTADDEIQWVLSEAFAPYMSVLSLTFIVPRHILGKADDPNTAPFNTAPVGTGPFRWGERRAGELVLLEKNPAYHGDGPYLDRVVFRYIPDQTMLYTQFRSGEIDYLGLSGLQPAFDVEARALPDRRIVAAPAPFVEHIALNHGFAPFADKAVRQALYLAMNRKARLEAIYHGRPIETESYVPHGHWAFDDGLPKHSHDPAAAKALLDKAGWLPGADGIRQKDGVRLAFTNSTSAGSQSREQAQQLLKQDWREIGVDMTIENMPGAVIWGEFWQKSQYQSVMVASNFLQGSDPDVTPRFSSKAIPAQGGSGLNTYQYRNPEVDGLLERGSREMDQAVRRKIYQRLQQIIREDLVFLPVSQSVIVEGVKAKLTGYRPNINASSNCWNMRHWFWAA